MSCRDPLRIILSFFILPVVILIITLSAAEICSRYLESKTTRQNKIENIRDPVLGWLPRPGIQRMTTQEYTVTYDINSFGMNDEEIGKISHRDGLRIMVLGDSHSFAYGVSKDESWPNLLEEMFSQKGWGRVRVYNCAAGGYNLGQYLLRMRQMQEILKPDIIIIGFSMSTDAYDFLPPRMGGFIYGGGLERVYFDLDENGRLLELKHKIQKTTEPKKAQGTCSLKFKPIQLEDFALFRRFKNSALAMWLGMRLGKRHLFLGSDVVFKKELDSQDRYCWQMVEQLLAKISQEAQDKHRKVVLVNIPYLAQVYDDVWRFSYGSMPQVYDRWIGQKRLEDICKRVGIYFIDTTAQFQEAAKRTKTRLHYKQDKHPTAEGQGIIAEAVYNELSASGIGSAAPLRGNPLKSKN